MIRASLALIALAGSAAAVAAPKLDPVWQDQIVIQRSAPVVVSGTAGPGVAVTGTLGSDSARTRAAADGTFALAFPARAASSAPIVLTVEDGIGSARVADIVVGDVWLCSGQSNMAMTVANALDGYNNVQSSADPLLRMLTVPLRTSARPERTFAGPVEWQKAAPETTGNFSATCYYMLKDLRRATNVPQGAIHSSWGGSAARAWLSPEGGRALYGEEQMRLLTRNEDDPLGSAAEFAPVWEGWWREETGQEPWRHPDILKWQPVPSISHWNGWKGTPLETNGVGNVLLRRTIRLTPDQAAAGGTLGIGVIDDMDATWVNGHPVGFTQSWSEERHYPIPAEFLKAGDNEVLVVATNTWGPGGFTTGPDHLFFEVEGGERIALGEGWLYSRSDVAGTPPRAPWDANAGIGVMHNRMIAPIGRFALKGATWYQGESDVGTPGYQDRLRELFAGWRRQFSPDMRLLVVQLADFGERTAEPVASGWAETRELQRRAVEADANAVLVSAIDLGEPTDIHPANKNDLGKRLALAAQGHALPMPEAARLAGDTVTVAFSGVEGGLRALDGPFPLGIELCGPSQDSCRYVIPELDGDRMLIRADGKPATRVRHAWADAPIVNLYDARGLPVPGFELAIER